MPSSYGAESEPLMFPREVSAVTHLGQGPAHSMGVALPAARVSACSAQRAWLTQVQVRAPSTSVPLILLKQFLTCWPVLPSGPVTPHKPISFLCNGTTASGHTPDMYFNSLICSLVSFIELLNGPDPERPAVRRRTCTACSGLCTSS